MCGFLAEFLFNKSTKITESRAFKELLAISKHRGPDSTEISRQDNYQLGFNRLSILDLSDNANQPIFSPSRRYHLVFNGEIYNFLDLAKIYDLGDLRSKSDTEVLVQLMDKIGIEETINQLNGMFAITVIDNLENELYLIRDYAGIKPLFFGVCEDGMVAASQFNQVFKHPWFRSNLELRSEIIKEYFGFGYMQAPNTIYKNIYQVLPGEYIKVDSVGEIKKVRFKKFGEESAKLSENPSVLQMQAVLNKAVKSQLISDVPLATFLSGGIDSPLISAMAKQGNNDIKAFSLKVENKQMDESAQASIYAKKLDLDQKIVSCNSDQLLNDIEEHFKTMPEPFGDYSSIPTYEITKQAKKYFSVMLSGDGGDELYFGYPRMLDLYAQAKWFNIPFCVRRPIYRIAKKLFGLKSWGPYNFKTLSLWQIAKNSYIPKDTSDEIFKDISFSREMENLYDYKTSQDLLSYLRLNEFYAHMQRILVKVDRSSMANSLEVRVPFLDKENIELAFRYKPKVFKTKSDLKSILKSMMLNFFPEETISKDKKGFTVPMEDWLKNELNSDVQKVVINMPIFGGSLMDCKALRLFVQDFFEGKNNSAWGVWHIYAWQKWAIKEELI
ncbi:asparagine synthase (glutamine-hydrolysing) [Flavobacteriaceae bacterium MAR_2010_188]|nr:asparagine synthase (glutamine-hydrolysing) [Flavobacteriaceae bacterium MAR_2010_188]